jgi:hypothetical protein
MRVRKQVRVFKHGFGCSKMAINAQKYVVVEEEMWDGSKTLEFVANRALRS